MFEVTARSPVQGIEVTLNNLFVGAFTLTNTCQAVKFMSATAFRIVGDVWDWAKESVDRRGPILDDTECNHTLLKMRILAFLPISPCSTT